MQSQINLFDVITEETEETFCKVCGQPHESFVHEECLDKLIEKIKKLENENIRIISSKKLSSDS